MCGSGLTEDADAWFEEDAPIYDHPKSPARMDILPSSREIEVKIAGVTVAKSSNEQLLLERGLRPRYYLPKTSVSCGNAACEFQF